jgi:sec-independent protein translocase protein TatA
MSFPQGFELVVIALLIVLLFGAKKLPGLGRSVGETMTEFRKGMRRGADEDEAEDEPSKAETDREREKER